jgi:phosphonate transport system substrate-binding protein
MARIIALVFLAGALAAAGCSALPAPQDVGYVDLRDLQPVKPVQQEIAPLRVAVASVISPKGTIRSYEPLLEYLQRHFNRPVELIQRKTYLETNDLISAGEVDLAFVCTSAYIAGHDDFGLLLLAAPQVNGGTEYYSNLIVPAASSAGSMDDLQGRVFAFTDPISLTGRMYPTYLVQQLGFTPEEFFAQTFFTYNHDEAIRAVANRITDGAAVDSLVYEYAITRDPQLASQVRLIHRSPPFAIPPVVVSPRMDPALMGELQKTLLAMDKTAEGQMILASIGVERFTTIEDAAYDGVRQLLSEIANGT